jgi:V8-like Glu-specific endopeptidase
MARPLTGDELKEIDTALRKAFPTYNELTRMVRYGIDQSLDDITGHDADMRSATFQLLQWSEAEGITNELLLAARNAKPQNTQLRSVAERLGVAMASRLESVFTSGPALANVEPFLKGLSRSEVCVCRVEIAGDAKGTGFLISPSLVMTNYHVFDKVLEKVVRAASVIIRFDYKIEADGTKLSRGVEYNLADKWFIDSSPIEELDYAIVALQRAAGEEPIGGQQGAPNREFLHPKNYEFERGENVFVIQHPGATTLKLGVGKIEKLSADRKIVCHTADTEPGSSGSPCFNIDWDLVAIHRQGKNFDAICDHNGAINMTQILTRAKVRNALALD